MKLCSIINVWADCVELLPFCIENHLQFCDGVIVVWSQYSNHGVKNDAVLEYIITNKHDSGVDFVQVEPWRGVTPLNSETRKRNHGISVAREKGFSHFLIADADEFYNPELMNLEKELFGNLNGLVHPLFVYVGKPTLRTVDHTRVCGIHKLTKDVSCGGFRWYPFAIENGHAHIDPSRRISFTDGIELSKTPMHHFSYVRKNIDLKIDNSSANLRNSRQVIYDELRDAKPGYVSRLYHQPLQSCENYFNLPIW